MPKVKSSMSVGLLIIFWAFVSSHAQAADWQKQLYDKENDILVYTRKVKGSKMKAFRAITRIKSNLSGLVALLEDTSRTHKWVYKCKAMALIEQVTETEAIYYMLTDMPWPVKDRESISQTNLFQDPVSKVVRINVMAKNDVFPENDELIRVRKMQGYWQLTPLDDGMVEVIYEAHADPGGGLPSWLVNSFVVEAPHNTLLGLRKEVSREEYQKKKVPYVSN